MGMEVIVDALMRRTGKDENRRHTHTHGTGTPMLNLVLGFRRARLGWPRCPAKWVIARLKQLKATQNVSSDAPTSHSKKQGTPTMGGVLILFALTAIVVLGYFCPDADGERTFGIPRRTTPSFPCCC